MAEHRPDVKALTPVATVHITAACRNNPDKSLMLAFHEAKEELWRLYRAQVERRPGATVSLALYVSDPEKPGEADRGDR